MWEAAPHGPADWLLPQLPDPGIGLLFICSNPSDVGQSGDWGHIPQIQVRDVGQRLQGSKIHQQTLTGDNQTGQNTYEGHLILQDSEEGSWLEAA